LVAQLLGLHAARRITLFGTRVLHSKFFAIPLFGFTLEKTAFLEESLTVLLTLDPVKFSVCVHTLKLIAGPARIATMVGEQIVVIAAATDIRRGKVARALLLFLALFDSSG